MKDESNKSLYVVSSNDLIRAKYSYTLWEKRVFLYMISRIRRNETEFPMTRMNVKDLMRFFDTKSKDDYRIIKGIPESIIKKPFYIPYIAPDGEKRWMFLNVISSGTQPDPSEKREESYIELQFNPVLMPHLLELKEKFTKYNIKNLSELQSVYSIRMFEFIKENEFKRDGFEITIDELKEMLFMKAIDNAGSELYPLYGDFKKRVLMKAQEDLTEHCDTTFEFEERKDGKRVVAIYFRPVSTQKNKSKDDSSSKTTIYPDQTPFFNEIFNQVKDFGIGIEILQLLIDTQPETAIRDGVAFTAKEIKDGKVKENVAGFFISAIKNRYTNKAFEDEKKEAQIKTDKKQKDQLRKALQLELEGLHDEYNAQVNDIIREITVEDSTITEKAMFAVRNENKLFFNAKKIDADALTVEDFRKDKILRGLVIQQIQILNPPYFTDINQDYLVKIKQLEKQIKDL